MKDNRKAEVVNEITKLAKRYAGTQQLREHMRDAVLAYIREQDRDTRHACVDAVTVAASYGDGDVNDMISVNEANEACMNADGL